MHRTRDVSQIKFPGSQLWDGYSGTCSLLASALKINWWGVQEERLVRGECNCDAVATEASVSSIRSPGAGIAFQSCSKLGLEGQTITACTDWSLGASFHKSDMTLDQEAFFGWGQLPEDSIEDSPLPIPPVPIRISYRTSLVAQWLRICLSVQGTQVPSLVWKDPTGLGATDPVHHKYSVL